MIEFVSDQIYHFEPLPFGGFLAFDSEYVYFHADGLGHPIDTRKLRRPLVVSAITRVDQYDPKTGMTLDGKDFLRYLCGTEGGEIYMIAFHLQVIKELTKGNTKKLSDITDLSKLSAIICIEFLGGRLSSCSSLEYLGASGLVYYASNSGDSYILKIESEKQPDQVASPNHDIIQNNDPDSRHVERPYISIVEE